MEQQNRQNPSLGIQYEPSGFSADDAASPVIIPVPDFMEVTSGEFVLSPQTRVVIDATTRTAGEYLARKLRVSTGLVFEVVTDREGEGDIAIVSTQADKSLGDEGYALTVTNRTVTVRASQPAGAFYGAITILQLLPPEILSSHVVGGLNWSIPCVRIEDRPRFRWRGMMIDSGRHMIPKEEILGMLEAAAQLKLNVFHWHLTEDQGWRLEILKYPKLTEIGAWRSSSPPYGDREGADYERHGGFYTQDDIRQVVAYAAERHITVVPEIELPGHASAAIASYPQYGNVDVPGYDPCVMTTWHIKPYTFAPTEETFRFLEDILAEVCDLFPSTFIHIGGDEAPKTQWKQSAIAQTVMKREGLADEEQLQSWFIRRIGAFLASKGRRLVGWDEIQEGGLPKDATMMVWRNEKWARHALDLGNDVIMATTSHTYLDYYQAPPAAELAKGPCCEAFGGYLPLETVYSYDPAFIVEGVEQEQRILGTQGQLWGEYIKNGWKLEYMAFPRLVALAEVAWSVPETRDFADFQRRLPDFEARLDELGVAYHPDWGIKIGTWGPGDGEVLEWDVTTLLSEAGIYDVGFAKTGGEGDVLLDWVALLAGDNEIARDSHSADLPVQGPLQPCFALDLPQPPDSGVHYFIRAHRSGACSLTSIGSVYWDRRTTS